MENFTNLDTTHHDPNFFKSRPPKNINRNAQRKSSNQAHGVTMFLNKGMICMPPLKRNAQTG